MNIFTFYFPVVLWTSLTSAEEEKDCLSPPNTVAEELAEERKDSYSHYSVLKYNCRPGYMKEGNIYYMCKNGTWKRLNNVVCRRKSCGYPGDAQFGNFSIAEGNDFLFGSRVEYTCNDGYHIISQTNFRVCMDDGWSNDIPQCDVMTKCQKEASSVKVMPGAFIPQCAEKGDYRPMQCYDNNAYCWCVDKNGEKISGTEAYGPTSCQILKTKCQKEASAIKPVPGAFILQCDEKGDYRPMQCYDNNAYCWCVDKNGDKISGSEKCGPTSCQTENAYCGPPPHIVNGDTIEITQPPYLHGFILTYRCAVRYAMDGNAKVRCLNGKWTNPPACLEPCVALPEIMDRNNIQLKWILSRKIYLEHGELIEFRCRSGYMKLPGTLMRVHCNNGTLIYPQCF